LTFYVIVQLTAITKYLHNHGDYTSITSQLLNTNWEVLFEGLNTDEMWSLFHSKLLFLIDKYIPTQKFQPNSRPKWLNSSTLKAIKQKHKAQNTYKATHRHDDYVTYTTKRNIAAAAAVKRAKSDFELKLVDSVKQNPSVFWKYVQEIAKVHCDVMPLRKEDGSRTCSD